MKLAVFGATGGVGTQLVRFGLERGHTVTAVVRDPAKFGLPGHEALQVVTVPDVGDLERVRAAVSGCDAVLSGIGPSGFKDVGAASVPNRHVLSALQGTGVERFVVVSAAPVGPTPDGEGVVGRVMFSVLRRVAAGIFGDLARMERDVAASDLKWTVMRPPRLIDGAAGDYRTAIGGNVVNGHVVSRAAVAHAMLELLADDRSVRQVVGVAR